MKSRKIETAFKVTYLLLTLVSFNFFFIERPILTYLSYAVTAFALVITVLRATKLKDYINKYTITLMVFTAAYVASCVHTRQYGIMDNAKALIWMFIQYFLVFARNKNDTWDDIKKEAKIIGLAFLIYTAAFSLVSIGMLVINYSFFGEVNGAVVHGGFLWNRLWGAYADPNYGAILALESVAIAVAFLMQRPKKAYKILLSLNIALQYFYVAFSDSRTGKVAAAGMVFVGLLIYLYNSKPDLNRVKRVTASILIPFVCAVALYFSFNLITTASSAVRLQLLENRLGISADDENLTYEQRMELEAAEVGRKGEDINKGDISNNRFDIWLNAVDITKTSPILGVSFRNIQPYVADNQVKGIFLEHKYQSAHNFIVDVLLSQGILGLLILIVFIVLVFITYFKALANKNISKRLMLILTLLLLPCAVGGLFVSDLFYLNTGSAFAFWYVLGITMHVGEKQIEG